MTKLSNSLLARMLRLQKLFSNRRKWIRGNYHAFKHKNECYCLVGGASAVSLGTPYGNYADEIKEMTDIMGFETPDHAIAWNDDPERTIKEVQERVALGVKNARKQLKQSTETK